MGFEEEEANVKALSSQQQEQSQIQVKTAQVRFGVSCRERVAPRVLFVDKGVCVEVWTAALCYCTASQHLVPSRAVCVSKTAFVPHAWSLFHVRICTRSSFLAEIFKTQTNLSRTESNQTERNTERNGTDPTRTEPDPNRN